MDIDEVRILQAGLHKIPLCNEHWIFYYDETGNCRRLLLRDKTFNAPSALKEDFVLGGVVLEENCEPDINDLFNAFYLKNKKTMPEIKFEHLVNKERIFLNILEKSNIGLMLDWLIKNKVDLHYVTLNNLFYALADVVDSAVSIHEEFSSDKNIIDKMKDGLYHFAKANQSEILNLLYRYEYPNIGKDNMLNFSKEFSDMVHEQWGTEDFFMEMFCQLLITAGKQRALPFLENEESFVLIDNYAMLRMTRCFTFKHSKHIFDRDPYAEKRLDEISLTENGKPFHNYEFWDSKTSLYIQLSDMIVGLLSKTFQWLDSFENIEAVAQSLNEQQLQIIRKINCLIDRAAQRNEMLIQNVNSPMNIIDRATKLTFLAEYGG